MAYVRYEMKLMKVEIPKSILLKIPETERIFFIQSTTLLDSLAILHKLVYISNHKVDNNILGKASIAQAMFFLKLQAGILMEGWTLLSKKYFRAGLSKEFDIQMTTEGKKSLNRIKEYFGSRNIINTIRNEYAFHFSDDSSSKINDEIIQSPDTEQFEIYLSQSHGNCLYYISHVLTNFSLLRSINSEDANVAIDKVFKEILDISRCFMEFLGEYVSHTIIKYKELGIQASDVEIPNPIAIDEIVLPYFVKEEISG